MARRRVLILDSLVSVGTFGILPRRLENAELMDCVRRRSFLLADRRFTTRTTGGPPDGFSVVMVMYCEFSSSVMVVLGPDFVGRSMNKVEFVVVVDWSCDR